MRLRSSKVKSSGRSIFCMLTYCNGPICHYQPSSICTSTEKPGPRSSQFWVRNTELRLALCISLLRTGQGDVKMGRIVSVPAPTPHWRLSVKLGYQVLDRPAADWAWQLAVHDAPGTLLAAAPMYTAQHSLSSC